MFILCTPITNIAPMIVLMSGQGFESLNTNLLQFHNDYLYFYNSSLYYSSLLSKKLFILNLAFDLLTYYFGFLFLFSIPLCIYFEYKLLRLNL